MNSFHTFKRVLLVFYNLNALFYNPPNSGVYLVHINENGRIIQYKLISIENSHLFIKTKFELIYLIFFMYIRLQRIR